MKIKLTIKEGNQQSNIKLAKKNIVCIIFEYDI